MAGAPAEAASHADDCSHNQEHSAEYDNRRQRHPKHDSQNGKRIKYMM